MLEFASYDDLTVCKSSENLDEKLLYTKLSTLLYNQLMRLFCVLLWLI